MYIHKSCYGLCPRCVWRYNGGCSEWQREDNNMNEDYIGTPMEELDSFQRQLKRFDIKERGVEDSLLFPMLVEAVNGPYSTLFSPKLPSGRSDVQHQKTCPVCGRKLVNLYRRNREWKCRACWEEHNEQR